MVRSLDANSLDSAGTTRAAKSLPSSVVPIWQRHSEVSPEHRQAMMQRDRVISEKSVEQISEWKEYFRDARSPQAAPRKVTELSQRGCRPGLTQALEERLQERAQAELSRGAQLGDGSVRPTGH